MFKISKKNLIAINITILLFSPDIANARQDNATLQNSNYQIPGFFINKVINNDPNNIFKLNHQPTSIKFKEITFIDNGKQTTVGEFMSKSNTQGIIVIHGDNIVYENYSLFNGKDTLYPAYSITKALTSAALGVAIKNQKINSENDLLDVYSETLKNSAYSDVTFKQALTMSSGINIDKDVDTINMITYLNMPWNGIEDYILTKEKFFNHKPGDLYNYNDLDAGAIAMAIRASTGISLSDFVQDEIWKPAGMEFSAKIQIDHQGNELGGSGLYARLRDYARFGMIYANNGMLNNRQILSPEWINKSTQPVDYPEGKLNHNEVQTVGFGYSWWPALDKKGDFFSGGLFGQLVYVDPASRIVIAKMGVDLGDFKKSSADSVLAFSRAIRDKIICEHGHC